MRSLLSPSIRFIVVSAFFCLSGWAQAGSASPKSPVGAWEGIPEGTKLRIIFRISEDSQHKLSATMDSPDQGAEGIPVDEVKWEKGALSMEVKSFKGSYRGKAVPGKDEIKGKWNQGLSVALDLKKTLGNPEAGKKEYVPGDLKVRVLEGGIVQVWDGKRPLALAGLMIFTEGWKQEHLTHSDKDSLLESQVRLSDGARVKANATVKVDPAGIHLHYSLEPLSDTKVLAVQGSVFMPYLDWTSAPYRMGKISGKIPTETTGNSIIAQGDGVSFTLGPTAAYHGLEARLNGLQGLNVILEDDRKWDPNVSVILTHGEPGDKPWVWKKGEKKEFDFTLSFNRKLVSDDTAIAALEPKRPFPYSEESVVFRNAKAGVELSGTLTLPKSKGPFPAVVLISGSGPNDRNETVENHHPFLVLSDYLTRRGMAVLRYDKRGVGDSTGDYPNATSLDFAADALAALDYLKGRKDIDAKRIGLVGHSEGGLISPMVAAQSPDVSFVILMAGPGIDGEKILLLQTALKIKDEGMGDRIAELNGKIEKDILEELKRDGDKGTFDKKIGKILRKGLAAMKITDKESIGKMQDLVKTQFANIPFPWIKFFLWYDPAGTVEKLKCPVLALNGEKDAQVPPKENLGALEAALKKGGNTDYTIKEFPGLNHLFQSCKTGSPSEYSLIPETISPTVLQFMGEWIKKHTL